MSDITPLLGSSATGSVVAAAIWKGAEWLNKNASAQAKRDISAFVLNYESNVDLTYVTRHLPQVFEQIYGHKHWTWHCLRRSILTSTLYSGAMFLLCIIRPDFRQAIKGIADAKEDTDLVAGAAMGGTFFFIFLFLTAIPDYIALWKSRILLRWSCRWRVIRSWS